MSARSFLTLVILFGVTLPVVAQDAPPVATESPSDAAPVEAGVIDEALPDACAPAVDCCPQRCIRYVKHRRLRCVCCGCCKPPVETVLRVQDPCDCTVVEVPVCLPPCCEDAPCVRSRCGLLCRGVVTYDWCCGFKVRVVFRHCGDIVVHTFGG
jgi:hypothetical protein